MNDKMLEHNIDSNKANNENIDNKDLNLYMNTNVINDSEHSSVTNSSNFSIDKSTSTTTLNVYAYSSAFLYFLTLLFIFPATKNPL